MHLMQGANEQISERRHPNEPQGGRGDRSKAGLPAGYWQEKGGRAAAAAAMAAGKGERIA